MPWRANQYLYYSPKPRTNHFVPKSFFQFQMYPMKKTILAPTACLTSVYGKDNFIIILLQSTVTCVLVNNSILNSFSIFCNRTCINILVHEEFCHSNSVDGICCWVLLLPLGLHIKTSVKSIILHCSLQKPRITMITQIFVRRLCWILEYYIRSVNNKIKLFRSF